MKLRRLFPYLIWLSILSFAAIVAGCSGGGVEPQIQVDPIPIHGTVTSSDLGVAVSGVAVTVTNNSTGESASKVTDDSGEFLIPALGPGNYALSASRTNYYPYITTFDIAAGEGKLADFTMVRDSGSLIPFLQPDVLPNEPLVGQPSRPTQCYVRNLETDEFEMISVNSAGEPGNGISINARVTADGRYVVFMSTATNLVSSGTTSWTGNVFLYDRRTRTTTLISKDPQGTEGNGSSLRAAISADGSKVAFSSFATDLAALRDQSSQTVPIVSVYLYDRATDSVSLVSETSTEAPAPWLLAFHLDISGNGRFVAYEFLDNLDSSRNIYMKDLETGATTLVSKNVNGVKGQGTSAFPSFSADGRYVAFSSDCTDLIQGGTTPSIVQVYVADMQSDLIKLVSATSSGVEGDNRSLYPSISADGRFVSYSTYATNLVEGMTMSGKGKIIINNLDTHTNSLVEVTPAGTEANGGGENQGVGTSRISLDDRFVIFDSTSTDLIEGGTKNTYEVFRRDLLEGKTILVPLSPTGAEPDDSAALELI